MILPSQRPINQQRENFTVKMLVSDSLHLNSELNEESVTTSSLENHNVLCAIFEKNEFYTSLLSLQSALS